MGLKRPPDVHVDRKLFSMCAIFSGGARPGPQGLCPSGRRIGISRGLCLRYDLQLPTSLYFPQISDVINQHIIQIYSILNALSGNKEYVNDCENGKREA